MRFATAIFFALALCSFAGPALADIDQVEAREVARNNNCTPSKVDIYQQSLGTEGVTVYKVDCTPAKADNPDAPKEAAALLISCDEGLCALLRPVTEESK